jgi:hypothetical protein
MLLAQRFLAVWFPKACVGDVRNFADALPAYENLRLQQALASPKLALQVVAGWPEDHFGIEAKDHYVWLYRSFSPPTKPFPKVTGYRRSAFLKYGSGTSLQSPSGV